MGTQPRQFLYGPSKELSVKCSEREEQVLTLGGLGQNDTRWSHAITRRAAQVLWFKLTEILYPDKAPMVTSLAATAPLSALSSATHTTHFEVVKNGTEYTLVGRYQRTRWLVQLSELEVRSLWADLDRILYPVGWEGREKKNRRMN